MTLLFIDSLHSSGKN